MELDISIRRVLEAFLPGPASARILVRTYGMGIEESEQALASAIDQGLAEPVGPIGFRLTVDGRDLALSALPGDRRDLALERAEELRRRDLALRAGDP